jgi:hypothetical protein
MSSCMHELIALQHQDNVQAISAVVLSAVQGRGKSHVTMQELYLLTAVQGQDNN